MKVEVKIKTEDANYGDLTLQCSQFCFSIFNDESILVEIEDYGFELFSHFFRLSNECFNLNPGEKKEIQIKFEDARDKIERFGYQGNETDEARFFVYLKGYYFAEQTFSFKTIKEIFGL